MRGMKVVVGFALAVVGLPVFAQSSGLDTSAVTTAITEAAAAVAVIGAAVLAGPKIGARVWKWISRAL